MTQGIQIDVSVKVVATLRAERFPPPIDAGKLWVHSQLLGVGGEPRSKPSNPRIKEILNMILVKGKDGKKKTYSTKAEFLKDRPDNKPKVTVNKTPIIYPNEFSEFEVQAYLYSKLKRMGFDVRGEVSAPSVLGESSRFDIVIFKKKRADKILEVKRNRKESIHKQQVKYNKFGVKVNFIMGMEDAEKYIKNIRDYKKYLNKQKTLYHHTHYGNNKLKVKLK